jgi:hypothetical protein
MYVLRIEHPVPDYQRWKQAFDSDPLGREKMGVRRCRVYRATDDTNHVLIDLEFEKKDQAQAMVTALRKLWGRVEGTVMSNARTRIVEQLEDYAL